MSLPTNYPALPEWHPIVNYFKEAEVLRSLSAELTTTSPKDENQKFFNILNHLCEIETRFARKENQFFPFLEKHGWHGPSTGMWAFHDSIRGLLGEMRLAFKEKNTTHLEPLTAHTLREIHRLLEVETFRLFPNSLDLLTPEDWEEMSRNETEIGFMKQTDFRTLTTPEQKPDPRTALAAEGLASAILKMNEGKMTLDQINLMLQFIPFDLTFVDENDRVLFYNRGEERVFPRSAGVIGREVRFCHPPKSVGTVLQILEEFKKGTKDEAEFWIQFRGQFIHIRYFAVRDAEKNYKGVIEVSQNITEIQKLTGEKRLLNWS